MSEVWVIQHEKPDEYGAQLVNSFVGLAQTVAQAVTMVDEYLAAPTRCNQEWAVRDLSHISDPESASWLTLASHGAEDSVWAFRYVMGTVEE